MSSRNKKIIIDTLQQNPNKKKQQCTHSKTHKFAIIYIKFTQKCQLRIFLNLQFSLVQISNFVQANSNKSCA